VVTTIKSCTLIGVDADLVAVEYTIDHGLPRYRVAGLAAPPVREGATRIQRALEAADLLGQDDILAGCLLEAAYGEVDPTADLMPHVM
jgi:hypothetical protein